jgi:rhomboid family GlyGly-CTERM serine protease
VARGLRRLSRPGLAWAALSALAVAASLLVAVAEAAGVPVREALTWHREAPAQIWRCWSAAVVHVTAFHLGANLAGAALVGALGWQARLPVAAAGAWALAWPLTQALLWLATQPDRYLGLSGVLHAGVAVAAVTLTVRPGPGWRCLGVALAVGLLVKLILEAPWRGAVQASAAWDFPVAVGAHAAGALAGALSAALWLAIDARRAAAVSPKR